ncbi:MAG: redoxin domain-containing protein, partial [Nitratireductor sp.]|nr:redoxin domain-containing protein [Nitratireductor sp.]
MTIHINQTAPDFEVETTNGPINFHDFIGDSWVFFFSHPADFTPVCTTEIGRTAQLSKEFASRRVRPIGLSTDWIHAHREWIEDVNATQNTHVDFPIIADPEAKIARAFDMIHPGEDVTDAV